MHLSVNQPGTQRRREPTAIMDTGTDARIALSPAVCHEHIACLLSKMEALRKLVVPSFVSHAHCETDMRGLEHRCFKGDGHTNPPYDI